MDRAFGSAFVHVRAIRARIAVVALALAIAGPARADDIAVPPEPEIVPIECTQFRTIPTRTAPPAAWDAMISFAACIQDARVYRIEHEEELAAFVQQLQTGLEPSIRFYVEAIKHAPDRVKLRAVYYVGLGQVALMTRARSSITSPALRAPLEALLEPHAKLAYLLFAGIDDAATSDPDLASDVVSRYMVRSARELAALLRTRWPELRENDPSLARTR